VSLRRRSDPVADRVFWAVIAVVTAACTPEQGSVQPAWEAHDSAGVQIVTSGSTSSPMGRVEPEPVEIAEGIELHRVTAVRVLGRGRIVVANSGASELVLLEQDLRLGRRIGRRGDGPGEFQGISRLFVCADDSLVTYQAGPARMSVFDGSGTFVHTRTILPQGVGVPWEVAGVSADCGAVVVVRRDDSPGEQRLSANPFRILWFDGGADSILPVTVVPGIETAAVAGLGGVRTDLIMPFGNMPSWTVHGDRLYVGGGRAPEVKVYDRGGALSRVIRWRAEARKISASDRTRYGRIVTTLEKCYGPSITDAFHPLDAYPLPATWPLFSRLLVDDKERLWVQKYPQVWVGFESRFGMVFDTSSPEWWVFEASGALLGTVTTPASFTVHDIQGDRLAGIARDGNDVEQVRVYQLPSLEPPRHVPSPTNAPRRRE